MIIRPVVSGVVRPPVRSTLSKGGGVPESIVVDGVTYTRIYFGGVPLDQEISSQPLYGRAA